MSPKKIEKIKDKINKIKESNVVVLLSKEEIIRFQEMLIPVSEDQLSKNLISKK